jgi:hypothetical protein
MSNIDAWGGASKPGSLCVLRSYFGGGRDILVYVKIAVCARERR